MENMMIEDMKIEDIRQTTDLAIKLAWYLKACDVIQQIRRRIEIAWDQFYEQNKGNPKSIGNFLNSRNMIRDILVDGLMDCGRHYVSAYLQYSEIPYIDLNLIKNTNEIEATIRQETQGNSSFVEVGIWLKKHPITISIRHS